ncbi:Myb-like DNA-binding domain-containing protein [Spironucleus salmonicida]|uniref:Myb-like DNA-binding domain-containing protein n=1 Tax=Spironucleus salmonicida TaxID=348837 RepID=V6LE29_9EUKA|nr:Myb-like DNA-binding domain-containing protein [Spironucleus salmonicida]|eukprot:EST42755.1 Myb-like DNA-binding domain-containing protein [Spironucleus salmonicida]
MNIKLLINLAREHKTQSGTIAWDSITPYFPMLDKQELQNKLYNHMRKNKTMTQDLRKNHKWTQQEKTYLLELVEAQGKNWKKIVQYYPGKTVIHVKNQYHQITRKSPFKINQLGSVDSFEGRQVVNESTESVDVPATRDVSFVFFEIL